MLNKFGLNLMNLLGVFKSVIPAKMYKIWNGFLLGGVNGWDMEFVSLQKTHMPTNFCASKWNWRLIFVKGAAIEAKGHAWDQFFARPRRPTLLMCVPICESFWATKYSCKQQLEGPSRNCAVITWMWYQWRQTMVKLSWTILLILSTQKWHFWI